MGLILSFPISLLLILFLLRMKKEDPFPTSTIVKLLLFGALCTSVAGAATLIVAVVNAIRVLGWETIIRVFELLKSGQSEESITSQLTEIAAQAKQEVSFPGTFLLVFISVGLVEEVAKFLACKLALKKQGANYTWFDMITAFSLCGIGFQISEDILFASGDLLSVLLRALTPFHFLFGLMMGYLYGKYRTSSNRIYLLFSILIPALLHTLFDACVFSVERSDIFFIIELLLIVIMIIMVIVGIRKILTWHKTKELDIPIL